MDHGAHHDHGAVASHGHDQHAGHSVAMFRHKFWLSLILTVPVIAWSHDPQECLGQTPPFPGSEYLAAILGTIVFLYGGLPFGVDRG